MKQFGSGLMRPNNALGSPQNVGSRGLDQLQRNLVAMGVRRPNNLQARLSPQAIQQARARNLAAARAGYIPQVVDRGLGIDVYDGQGGNYSYAELERRLAILEAGGPIRGGDIFLANRNAGMPPYVGQTAGKGGILQTAAGAIPAGSPANTLVTVEPSAATLARLSGTVFELASVKATGQLSDPDELAKIFLTVRVNDEVIPTLNKVPCDVLADNLFGDERVVPARVFIGADSIVQAVFEVQEELDTTDAETIRLRLYAGNGQTFQI